MLENEFQISKLIVAHMQGTLSKDEQEALNEWRLASSHNQELFDELSLQSHVNEELTYFSKARTSRDSILKKVRNKLDDKNNLLKPSVRKLWQRIAVAAAVSIMIFAAGLYYYQVGNQSPPAKDMAYKNEIVPGKSGATLVLSNGKRIRLTDIADKTLALESGVVVSKTADGQIAYEIKYADTSAHKTNTLSTAKGETYAVTLPDKSRVWLNAASSLTYSPALIEHGKRVVKLSGEAYFEIAKDKAHPFIVRTDQQNVEVLGTHFNINSYADEKQTKTTLLEGSIKLSALKGETKVLIPGQQAVISDGRLMAGMVDTDDAVAWSKGYFKFNNENIYSIMRKISRWYDVDVQYADNNFSNVAFFGHISRSKNISSVLSVLELSENLEFKIEGRRVLVMSR